MVLRDLSALLVNPMKNFSVFRASGFRFKLELF